MSTQTIITRCTLHMEANAVGGEPLIDQPAGIPPGSKVEVDAKTAARLISLGLAVSHNDTDIIDATV